MRENKKSVKRRVKGMALKGLSFPLVSRGFIVDEAQQYTRKIYRSYRNKKYSFRETRWAHKRGFLPVDINRLGVTEENCDQMISRKEYAFLRPINGIYSKWLTDIVSVNAIFKPFRDVMPKCYYQINRRDGRVQVIPLYDKDAGDKTNDVVTLLREKKRLKVKASSKRKVWSLYYDEGKYFFNGKRVTAKELRACLKSLPGVVVVTDDVVVAEDFVGGKMRVIVFNEQGDNPRIGDAYIRFRKVKSRKNNDSYESHINEHRNLDTFFEGLEEETKASKKDDVDENFKEIKRRIPKDQGRPIFYSIDCETGELQLADSCRDMIEVNPSTGLPIPKTIPCWAQIKETVDKMGRFASQLEFFGMEIVITDEGFSIVRMLNHPSYPSRVPFSKETTSYLKKKVAQKKGSYTIGRIIRNGGKKIKLAVRASFAKCFFPKTLLPYLSIRWIQDVWKDFRTNKDTTLQEKIWAIRHGFISYRLHQYGITKENWKNYISDFEYKWLRHINNKYRHWMEDKITVKYVCSEYNDCFPGYYYHISMKNGNHKVLPMMDCPEGYANTYEDIFRLVREKGALALKPDEGSHGDGFYKFSYENGQYYLNHEEATEQDVLNILQDVKNQYLVTEYINMHEEIKRIYAGAVNTIRMIVFKKDGKTPTIGNAYMRFGSQRTGAVDNMGAGGMYAKVDVDTGRFYDAKIIEANEIKPCLYHPDTNVKIEGYLPNWEKVKKDVLDVASSIPQMEFFGFDLALTEDGLKFPEINRFPDYPAIEKYSPQTIDYLLHKLEVKKRRYGYTASRGKTLFKLPNR